MDMARRVMYWLMVVALGGLSVYLPAAVQQKEIVAQVRNVMSTHTPIEALQFGLSTCLASVVGEALGTAVAAGVGSGLFMELGTAAVLGQKLSATVENFFSPYMQHLAEQMDDITVKIEQIELQGANTSKLRFVVKGEDVGQDAAAEFAKMWPRVYKDAVPAAGGRAPLTNLVKAELSSGFEDVVKVHLPRMKLAGTIPPDLPESAFEDIAQGLGEGFQNYIADQDGLGKVLLAGQSEGGLDAVLQDVSKPFLKDRAEPIAQQTVRGIIHQLPEPISEPVTPVTPASSSSTSEAGATLAPKGAVVEPGGSAVAEPETSIFQLKLKGKTRGKLAGVFSEAPSGGQGSSEGQVAAPAEGGDGTGTVRGRKGWNTIRKRFGQQVRQQPEPAAVDPQVAAQAEAEAQAALLRAQQEAEAAAKAEKTAQDIKQAVKDLFADNDFKQALKEKIANAEGLKIARKYASRLAYAKRIGAAAGTVLDLGSVVGVAPSHVHNCYLEMLRTTGFNIPDHELDAFAHLFIENNTDMALQVVIQYPLSQDLFTIQPHERGRVWPIQWGKHISTITISAPGEKPLVLQKNLVPYAQEIISASIALTNGQLTASNVRGASIS